MEGIGSNLSDFKSNPYMNISGNSTDAEVFTENYSLFIKVFFSIIGLVTLITSFTACTAMYRTRRIPQAAKFLAMGLLTFDSSFIIVSTIRKFVRDPVTNLSFMVASTVPLQLSYITVGLMSLERYLVLCWPNFYLRHCSLCYIQRASCIIWFICVCTFFVFRYLICYVQFGIAAIFVAGTCLMLVTIYYFLIVILVLSVSFVCYYKIMNTIRRITSTDNKKSTFTSAAKVLRSYKSTSLVLVYFFVVAGTSLAYILILVLTRHFNLGLEEVRISTELVNILNCFLDPYLYVLWFSETKMELLKLVAPFSARIKYKVEDMRKRIYDIALTDFAKNTAKVAPVRNNKLSYM